MKAILLISLVIVTLMVLLPTRSIERFDNAEDAIRTVAIATMVSQQPDFERWLDYHLNTVGVDKIYLRIENTPDIVAMVQGNPKVWYTSEDLTDAQRKNNYFTQMDRQSSFVNKCIEMSKSDGIDVLFHVDADEFIKVRSGTLRSCLNYADTSASCIHFKNFEAAFDSYANRNSKCFKAKGFIDCQSQGCTSYANGKSAGVIRNNPKYHGPHFFTGKKYEMPDDKIVILHFDSCSFDGWKTKFKRMNPDNIKDIPFPFYRKSIELMKESKSEDEMLEFYEREKSGKGAALVTMEHFFLENN